MIGAINYYKKVRGEVLLLLWGEGAVVEEFDANATIIQCHNTIRVC